MNQSDELRKGDWIYLSPKESIHKQPEVRFICDARSQGSIHVALFRLARDARAAVKAYNARRNR